MRLALYNPLMTRAQRFLAWLSLASSLLAACAQQPLSTPTPAPTPDRAALQARILDLQGAIGAHDPVIIKADGVYYRFATGPGIPMGCSSDLIKWRECGRVFSRLPISAYKAVPGVGDLWAPDISLVNGTYRLYYSASSFGSNKSAIVLATNVTLDATRKDYKWVDQGVVVDSRPGYSYNAIDPNYVAALDGTAWLAFGSFWSGIKLLQLDPATGKALPNAQLMSLARRAEAPGAIEAAFITHRDGYYYLFVSFDQCCKGVNSTYNMRVGRSKTVTGPYLDRAGKDMLNGGGTLILSGNDAFRGPGHNAILIDDGRYLLAYHAYDIKSNGVPLLHIEELLWDEGWPQAPSALLADR
jgi:arabinan endo-1,5-alpha-L-arabinosidase